MIATTAATRLEWPCRLVAGGSPNCPICRSPSDGPVEQAHRRAVLYAVSGYGKKVEVNRA